MSLLHGQAGGEQVATGAAGPVAASYVLEMEGQSSEPWRWRVSGGPGVTAVYGEEKTWAPDGNGEEVVEWELRLLAGPALDGIPSRIEEDWGALAPAIAEPPAGLESGEFVYTDLGPTAYDSVRWDLSRGERDETVAGRDAEHWVLTVNSWGRKSTGEDDEIPFESIGQADLWFDATLPFSAVPFAVARGSGFPLATLDPGTSRFVLHEALPELRERGLLLRAEISSSQLQQMEGVDEPFRIEPDDIHLTVSSVQPDGSAFDDGADRPTVDDYVRLDAERTETLTMSGYLVSACQMAGAITDASNAEGAVAGRPVEAGAVFSGGAGETLRIVVATPEEDTTDLACLVAVIPAGAAVGSYRATVPDREALQAGTPPEGHAWATVIGRNFETGALSMLVVQTGDIELESVETDRVEGSITLNGWMLKRTADAERENAGGAAAELIENAQSRFSFLALPES